MTTRAREVSNARGAQSDFRSGCHVCKVKPKPNLGRGLKPAGDPTLTVTRLRLSSGIRREQYVSVGQSC